MQAAKRMLTLLPVSVCAILYGYAAIDTSAGRAFSISVDLSKPESIAAPFEIAIVGEMGQEGVRIAPKAGAGWKGEAGGQVTYRFYVPEDGRYHVWAYALWFDKCTNAVFAEVDGHERAIIGNDPVYGKWHWVRGFGIPLRKGAHLLRLSNHSDNIALLNVLFISSDTVLPDDCSVVFSDVFYDGFDGCHIGNFTSWDLVRGDWAVRRPAARHAYFENALVGRSRDSAMILYRADDWSNYSFDVAVRTMPSSDPAAAAGILFGVQDPNHWHRLKWKPIQGSNEVEMHLARRADGRTEQLATFRATYQPNVWHQVEVVLEAGTIRVNLDSAKQLEWPVDQDITGGIGLVLEGKSTACFDNAHVRTVTNATDRGFHRR